MSGGLTLLDLHLRLSAPARSLDASRVVCPRCGLRRSLLCHDCGEPLCAPLAHGPRAELPLAVHVWRERGEDCAASTASQVLATTVPGRAAIFDLDTLPTYADPGGVLVLFPCAEAIPASALPDISRFHTLAVIDCTWHKSGRAVMMLRGDSPGSGASSKGEARVPFAKQGFVFVHLPPSYGTLFWRYQSLGASCLSTVEAVYFFLREFAVESARRQRIINASCDALTKAGVTTVATDVPTTQRAAAEAAVDVRNELYTGSFDDLVLFFLYKYHRIQDAYAASGAAFNDKHRAGYITSLPATAPAVSGKRARDAEGGPVAESANEFSVPATGISAGKPRKIKGAWAVRTDVLDAATARFVDARQRQPPLEPRAQAPAASHSLSATGAATPVSTAPVAVVAAAAAPIDATNGKDQPL